MQAGDSTSTSRSTTAYYFAFVALGLGTAAIGPTLPGLAEQVAVPLAAISVIFATQSAGYITGSLAGGQIFDRIAGHPVLMAALLATAALLALIPAANGVALLAMLFFGVGFFQGALDVGGNTLIGWLHGAKVGPYMNALHFFFGLGAFAAPLVVAWALTQTTAGIAWSYWGLAALIALSALFLIGVPSPPNAYRRSTDRRFAQPTLLIGLIVLFFLLYVGAEHTFGGWVFSYASLQPQGAVADPNDSVTPTVTVAAAAYLNSAFWGAFTLGRLISIPLAAQLRPRVIILSDLLLALAGLGMILLWPHSLLVLWIGVIVFGMAIASVFPTMLIWAGRRIRLTGSVTGLFFVGGSTGAMVFPWLTGQFFDHFGPNAAIWTVFGVVVATMLVFFLVMARGGPVHTGR